MNKIIIALKSRSTPVDPQDTQLNQKRIIEAHKLVKAGKYIQARRVLMRISVWRCEEDDWQERRRLLDHINIYIPRKKKGVKNGK